MSKMVWQVSANLNAMEKYVLEYLVNSPYGNNIGYYRVPLVLIQYDTGLTKATVEEAVFGLIEKNFISYDIDRQVVAIKDFHRFSKPERTLRANQVLEILEQQPASPIVKTVIDWLSRGSLLIPSEKQTMEENDWVKEGMELSFHEFKRLKVSKREKKDKTLPVSESKPVYIRENASENLKQKEDVKNPANKTENIAAEPVEKKHDANKNLSDKEKEQGPTEKKEKNNPVKEKNVEDFDALWSRYPKKESKGLARDGYLSMIKNGDITFEIASHAIDNYLYQIKKNKTEEKYIISGRNFFSRAQKRILEYVDSPSEENVEESMNKIKDEILPKFNMFWAVYPRKNGKESAEKNFIELVKNGEFTSEQLIEAARGYNRDCRAKNTDEQYIKRADTFLDLETRPFRDYLDRDDLSSFNAFSGEIENKEVNGADAMREFVGDLDSLEEGGENGQNASDEDPSEPKPIEAEPTSISLSKRPILMEDEEIEEEESSPDTFDPDVDIHNLGFGEETFSGEENESNEIDWGSYGEEDNPENW